MYYFYFSQLTRQFVSNVYTCYYTVENVIDGCVLACIPPTLGDQTFYSFYRFCYVAPDIIECCQFCYCDLQKTFYAQFREYHIKCQAKRAKKNKSKLIRQSIAHDSAIRCITTHYKMAGIVTLITFLAICFIISAAKGEYSFSCGESQEMFDLCSCVYLSNGNVTTTCDKSPFLVKVPSFPAKLAVLIGRIDMTGTKF